MRKRRQPDPIRESCITVTTFDDVWNALNTRAPDGPTDTEREHAAPTRVLKARFQRHGKTRPAETRTVADEVVRRNAFIARTKRERETFHFFDGISDPRLDQILI